MRCHGHRLGRGTPCLAETHKLAERDIARRVRWPDNIEVAVERATPYLLAMSTTGFMASPPDRPETEEERDRRLAYEAEVIACSRAEAAEGRLVPLEAVIAWVESWNTDDELPPPSSQIPPRSK